MLAQWLRALLGGRSGRTVKKNLTVMFLRKVDGFGSAIERLEGPSGLRLVNAYFAAMEREIEATGGIIDKIMDDVVAALWGVDDDPHHAEKACIAAVRCIAAAGVDRASPR